MGSVLVLLRVRGLGFLQGCWALGLRVGTKGLSVTTSFFKGTVVF